MSPRSYIENKEYVNVADLNKDNAHLCLLKARVEKVYAIRNGAPVEWLVDDYDPPRVPIPRAPRVSVNFIKIQIQILNLNLNLNV